MIACHEVKHKIKTSQHNFTDGERYRNCVNLISNSTYRNGNTNVKRQFRALEIQRLQKLVCYQKFS